MSPTGPTTHATSVSAGRPALAFAHCPRELGLYGVLPTAEWVGRMARAGVPTVQLRFKSGDKAAVARSQGRR
jgi:thiamine-phosphate pyrophosphorylase